MGYIRLFRRVRIAPGLTMNLTKSGPSLSLGVPGAHVTVGRSGVRRTVGIPGTGVFYTSHDGWHSGIHTAQAFHDAAPESGNYEAGCFWTESGNGSRTAVWRNDDPMLGEYKIYVYFGHPSAGRLATDAPFTVVTDAGSTTLHFDFSRGAGEWHLLGSFHNPRYVKMTNAADGAVIADAMKFVRASVE